MSAFDPENGVPLTSPGGLVQSGGYMNASGPDRAPAIGISQMTPVQASSGGAKGLSGESGATSLMGGGGGFLQSAMTALAAL